ncbi:MAG: DUF488 domain-containing protein [Candidimonas sp.]
MAAQFVTIGHSDRNLDEFLDMLRAAQVGEVIDVRRFPRSRTNLAYNIDRLPEALARVQIGYRHWAAFGGRRPKQPGVDENINALWRVQSFHNYADYALSDDFATALRELERLGRDHRLALMCAEAVWWRCHRRIIADHLLLHGHAVDHLMGLGHIEHATPTPGVRKDANGEVTYPASSSTGRAHNEI